MKGRAVKCIMRKKQLRSQKNGQRMQREQILDTLCECVEKFEKNPSYKTREVYFSLI